MAPGAASVSGGFGPYAKSLDITVRDPERERIAGQYPDIANHWAREEIITAIQEGLFRGTGANTFSPETARTQGQLVTGLHRLAGTPEALSLIHILSPRSSSAHCIKLALQFCLV